MSEVETDTINRVSEKLKTLSRDQLKTMLGLMDGWQVNWSPEAVAPVSSSMAQSVVNDWLLQVLPDRFMAAEAKMLAGGDVWYVPVILTYPTIGAIGHVGEVLVSAFSAGIISATQADVMRAQGVKLYEARSHDIEASFL
jgi:hypothetical protein